VSLSLLTSARLLTRAGPVTDAWLRIEDGRIADFDSGPPPPTEGEVLDVAGATVTPGLIDVHVHGGDGNETMGGGPEGLTAMARFHARHGVTSLLPSTWTAPHAEVLTALRDVAEVTGPVDGGATILGAHVEGPYINVARKGAHRQELIRPAERAEAGELLDTDVVRLLALAPEIDANHWLLDACVERGVTVAAGHTDATYAQLATAAERGVRQATHVFNGMRGLHHREPGAAGGALSLDTVRCELIADGVHVAPPVMDLVWRAKGPDGTLLITDAGKGAGLPDGEYERAGRTITVAGGVMRLEDGTITGSTATLEVGLHRFLAATGTTLDEVWQVATLTPARAIGVADRKGSIEVGKDADLAVFDEAGAVTATVVEGRLVHRT
jgi:N-acetylglucosamine-6-phosphate deacetylase